MSNSNVLTITELIEITGYDRGGDVKKCLESQGIRTFRGKNGVWTTLSLVNAAGGIVNGQQQDDQEIL
jgi:hypothetical protein